MKNAISWFEIPCADLAKAQRFYEQVLGCTVRREAMRSSEGALFPYDGEGANKGVGCALMCGQIARPRQAMPPGIGFFAHIVDPDGNRVGLHALA